MRIDETICIKIISTFSQNFKTLKKGLLFLIFILQVSFVVRSQEYYLKHFQVEDGLSHNSVICSLQDKDGFLWFGTKDGLNRFDGYNYKLYRNESLNNASIGSNFIQAIYEHQNFLWVGTDNGLYKFDKDQDKFTLLSITKNQSIQDIESDIDGNIWFIAGGTLYKYEVDTNKYVVFDPADFFDALSITKSPDNTLWIASFNQIYKYDANNVNFTSVGVKPIDSTEFPYIISTIESLSSKEILIGTQNHGAIQFNIQNGTQQNIIENENEPIYVRDFTKKGADELWIGTENGLYIYNLQTQKSTHLQKNYKDHYALSDNAIYTVTVDNEQGVWLGTYFGGINYYPKQYTPFKKYFPKFNENSISGNIVREIKEDEDGNLWIGTEDAGINKFNPKTEKFININPKNDDKTALAYYNIHGILPDKDKIWVGTFEHGLDALDKDTGLVIKHYGLRSKGGLHSNFVYSIFKTLDKEILILTTSGIQKYNKEKDFFEDYSMLPERYFFTTMAASKKNELWVGSYRNGLYLIDKTSGAKKNFTYNPQDENSISSNAINQVFISSNETVWITTENGLNKYNHSTGNFERFTVKNGLPSNLVYSILEDNKQNLWISSSNGLVEFNPVSEDVKVYTKANGLTTDQFNYNAAYKDAQGNMYFGSVDGMIFFNQKNFVKNTYTPPLYITDIKINNKEVNLADPEGPIQGSISSIEKLNLKHNQSSISVDVAALSYNAPQMTKYWYKLEGLNTDWVELNKSHTAYFTKLSPGSYTLKYKALNWNGSWSMGRDLEIDIAPPFWASTIAYACYILIVSLLVISIIIYYHKLTVEKNDRKIRQLNNKKEKEVYQAKIEFFTNIAHEIRTPLTLIKSPLEKLLKVDSQNAFMKDNLNIMSKNTSRLLDLVNQLLDFRKTEIEGLNLNFIEVNITNILKNTYTRFSNAIKEKELLFELYCPDEDVYAHADEEALKKILSNLFNNAIKYAKNKVSVIIKKDRNEFVLIVKNDGELIPHHLKEKIFEPFFRLPEANHQTGTGIGLSLAYSLTELHNGTLILDTIDVYMNTFILKLPLYQERKFDFYEKNKLPLLNENIIEDVKESNAVKEVKQTTILLVEDNEDLLDFLANDLENDYSIVKANTAEKALETIQIENIQLVISDVMMPGMSGFEMCKKIKTSFETSHIPVILLTSKSAINAKVEGLECGADAYIEKPFSIEYVHIQIKNILENRKHIMKHYSSSPLAHIKSIGHAKPDESFIKSLDKVIYDNLSDPNLSVEVLAEIMNMSRSTLYRKIKDLSNLSPNELINITRLKKAAELLKTGDYKIYEVSEMVGYNSQTSFGRNFQKQFNMTPTEYINKY